MKSHVQRLAAPLICVSIIVAVGRSLSAQSRTSVQYQVINLGTLGGTLSDAGGGMNDRGWVVGGANLPGDTTEHASLWWNGTIVDLGTLGGSISGAGAVNDSGLIFGASQISTVDPLGESWGAIFSCVASVIGSCQDLQFLVRGFLWRNGVMTALPTLGGNNGFGFGVVNNLDQAVGVAETSVADPSCVAPQVLDYEAVIWGPEQGEIRELPPLIGDTNGIAMGINDAGVAVGESGTCGISFASFAHAVLWRNGAVTNLGSLGGAMNNYAARINNRGQVVGGSDLPGDATSHAFLWQHGVITDLGTLPGDFYSIANAINDAGQIVGQSCNSDFSVCRAFLWQNGTMADLNSLTVPGSSLYLLTAEDINSRGQISGQAFDQDNGEIIGFLATAVAAPSAGVPFQSKEREHVILPQNVRELMHRHRGLRRF